VPENWSAALTRMMTSPNLCRKRWIWEQYDHMVRTNTVVGPGSDATVLRLKESNSLLALSTDCNPRHCYLDPEEGARAAVAESCRNIVCSGGKPLAATNCLNFASPENPEVMWQFSQAVDGIREACEVFQTPITGGNVSFYNETCGMGIYPTPVIGMVGLIEHEELVTPSAFRAPADVLILLGPDKVSLGGSEYLEVFHARIEGIPAAIDLDLEKRVQGLVAEAIRSGLISSAHDCSEGGLLVAAVESSLTSASGLGCNLSVASTLAPHEALFGEGPSRILLSVAPEHAKPLLEMAGKSGVPAEICGRVTDGALRVVYNGSEVLSMRAADLFDPWDQTMESWFRK
jgi:phosphoribosylformylglycinamidine (FGAM) synthase-like enzyme